MSAILRLIVAGAAAALISAPAIASDRLAKLEPSATVTAQESCTGWGVRCESDITAEFCIADGKCAVALPASALVRYDQRMDAAASR
jgi:hypothetical protein